MKIVLIVFLLIISFLVISRLMFFFKAWKMKGKEAPTLHGKSQKRIRAGKKTLLYFSTPTCRACKMQDPIIQRVEGKYPDAIFKINALQNRDIATAYGVMGVPFIAFVEKGIIVKASAGVQSETNIENFFADKK
ncbi:MAG: thioredoxin family protein [Candidatus Theseobacter exili]|nr:thioredoxin family protein [Candidatus Theseobacter exili]